MRTLVVILFLLCAAACAAMVGALLTPLYAQASAALTGHAVYLTTVLAQTTVGKAVGGQMQTTGRVALAAAGVIVADWLLILAALYVFGAVRSGSK